MHQNKVSRLALGLCLILLGCSPVSKSEIETEINTPIPTVTVQAGTPEPLCALGSKYRVGLAEFNTPVSQCNIYFYVDFRIYTYEKFFRVIIQPNKPFTFTEDGYVDLSTINQIKPYHYRWTIKNAQGLVERAWLAYFIKNRDGTYHTIITQPEQDWKNSVLEIYFEDVNNDGVRENVTYEIVIGDFLTNLAP